MTPRSFSANLPSQQPEPTYPLAPAYPPAPAYPCAWGYCISDTGLTIVELKQYPSLDQEQAQRLYQ